MKTFNSYLIYLTKSLLRSFYFYVSTFLYFIVLIFMMYILPIILDAELIVVTRYIYFFTMIIFFAIFNVASIVAIIFRQSIDDGSELILQSKPISRSILAYTKITLFFLVSVIIACISSLACIFTSFSFYGGKEIAKILSTNVLIGTVLIYCFFGGVSILACMFFKQLTTIVVTVSLFLVMMFYSMVASQIFMSITKYLRVNEHLYLNPVSLVIRDENSNSLSYKGGVAGAINNSSGYITNQIYNDIKPEENVSASKFLQYKWNDVVRKTNFIDYINTNLAYQLASIYTDPPQSYLLQPIASLSYLLRSSNSFNIKVNFDTQQDTSTINKLINFKYNQIDYVVTNTTGVYFSHLDAQKLIKTNILNTTNEGTMNYFDDETLLPSSYNLITQEIQWTKFTSDLTSLQSFVDHYLSTTYQTLIQRFNKIFSDLLQMNINPLSVYTSLFNVLNIQDFIKQNIMTPQNYNVDKNIERVLNKTASQLSKFQYLASLCLQNQSQLNVSNEQLTILANTLMIKTSDDIDTTGIITLALPVNQIISIIPELIKDPSKISNYLNYLYISSPVFSSIETDNLTTFNFVTISSYYNMTALILSWFSVSAVLLIIAIACYFKHDFH